ncbi:acylneuraminate cytidylyltransferase family protein [Gammaproteobacteria bacterium]|nr:acylneuraminate cytidylyltransferase family protein [Gammaproteobacteria bacterium]
MRVTAIIPARGGSKGIKKKNTRRLCGKPLIQWTIDAALTSRVITNVVVSSDDAEILRIASLSRGVCCVKRPSILSTDSAASTDVVAHSLEVCPSCDYFVLLQPTSPLRTARHIDDAFELMMNCGRNGCISVVRSKQSPYWMYERKSDLTLSPVLKSWDVPKRRQDLPVVFVPNGAIYICESNSFRRNGSLISADVVGYEMHGDISIDIDTLEDFEACKLQFEKQKNIDDGNGH